MGLWHVWPLDCTGVVAKVHRTRAGAHPCSGWADVAPYAAGHGHQYIEIAINAWILPSVLRICRQYLGLAINVWGLSSIFRVSHQYLGLTQYWGMSSVLGTCHKY